METPESEQPESVGPEQTPHHDGILGIERLDSTQQLPSADRTQPTVPLQTSQSDQWQGADQLPAATVPIDPSGSQQRPAEHSPKYSHAHRLWRPRNFLILGAAAAALAIAGTSVGVTMAVGIPLALKAASSTTTLEGSPVPPSTTGGSTGSGGTGSGSAGSGSIGSGSGGTSSDPGYGSGSDFGFGQGGSSSGRGSAGSGSATQSATDATDAQGVGVVLIDTKLEYQSAAAAGTGVILSADGYILTNNHVVEGSTSISVTVATTGKTYTAKVVGTDAVDDVAVLKLDGASGLTAATLDTSETVAVGDRVTGVGNAGGTGTLSAAAGTVTGLDQSVTTQAEGSAAGETLDGLIQVEADIQAGDSGGPLYDAQGEVIGIDTAASSGSATVTGFAIPINTALTIAKQISSGTESGNVTIGYPAFLGVEIGSATSGSGRIYGYGSRGGSGTGTGTGTGTATVAGATVAGVIDGTPAATAGLVAGDTITAVDGTTIDSGSTLTSTMKSHNPGDSVTVTWTDASGANHSASVTLVEGPAA
ncbi:hypothetical protein BH09ACT6_BH09ACT6_11760 [soil metagenome]